MESEKATLGDDQLEETWSRCVDFESKLTCGPKSNCLISEDKESKDLLPSEM